MKAIVSVKDIVNEMDISSDEHSAFLNKQTGELITLTEEELAAAEEDEDLSQYPEWQQEMISKAREVHESEDFLPLPSRFDIHEYRIMEDFCYSVKDDKIRESLLTGIQGRGAFRRFRELIREHEIEEEWYRFRQEEFERVAIAWLEENKIPFTREKG